MHDSLLFALIATGLAFGLTLIVASIIWYAVPRYRQHRAETPRAVYLSLIYELIWLAAGFTVMVVIWFMIWRIETRDIGQSLSDAELWMISIVLIALTVMILAGLLGSWWYRRKASRSDLEDRNIHRQLNADDESD